MYCRGKLSSAFKVIENYSHITEAWLKKGGHLEGIVFIDFPVGFCGTEQL